MKHNSEKNINTVKNKLFTMHTIVGIAVFSALAFVVSMLIRVPVQFLTFDAKDAIITIAAFIYGPIAAPIISLLAALIELVTISDTGIYGFLMNFISSATYSATASLIYGRFRSLNGALVGIYSAVIVTTAAMMGANILITPYFMKVSSDVVIALLPTLFLPFNFAKTLMNSAAVMLLYKPVTLALSRVGLISKRTDTRFTRSSIIIILAGVASLVAAIAIFAYLSLTK